MLEIASAISANVFWMTVLVTSATLSSAMASVALAFVSHFGGDIVEGVVDGVGDGDVHDVGGGDVGDRVSDVGNGVVGDGVGKFR